MQRISRPWTPRSTKPAGPVSAEEVASSFDGKVTAERRDQVRELLQTLAALGQARVGEDGRWSEGERL